MGVRSAIKTTRNLFNSQLGFDPSRLFKGLVALPGFARNYRSFRKNYDGTIEFEPYLHDRDDGAGTQGEYFWQDLCVARMIAEAKPARHVDIGSRIDGFIAHLASFRDVEVVDIRPLPTSIPGVTFIQGDATAESLAIAPSPSVSCLHTIEHFGLGRYGDRIDPDGMRKGLLNLATLVAPGGTLYVSTPIGNERVMFNAHRISHPDTVLGPLLEAGLQLRRVLWFDGTLHESSNLADDLMTAAQRHYALGIFVLTRPEQDGTSPRRA
jgi:hypothetical protein